RLNDLFRLALTKLLELFRPQSARIPGIALINLLLRLHAGGADLLRIDHHHMVASIEKWRIARIFFAHQNMGHTRSETPQRLIGSIDDVPLAYDFPLFGEIGRHCKLSQENKSKEDR